MKNSTFNSRTAKATKNSKGYQYAKQLLTDGKRVYTCHTSGSGRFTTNLDYTNDTESILLQAGLTFKDYNVGNDSPRGGKTGNYIELTSRGKTKMIK